MTTVKKFDIPPDTRFPEPRHYMMSKYRIASSIYSDIYMAKYYSYVKGIKISRKCAVKVLKQYTPEYEIAGRLNHPNVLKPLGTYQDFRHMVIFYPWVNNGTLHDWIVRRRMFSESDIQTLFKQMIDAVKYCHMQDVMHQDLKLENFLITSKNKIKLTDFGLSDYESKKSKMIFCGSPMYMAPEIMMHESHGFPADLWSLGICLYELVYGRLPYENVRELDELRISTMKGVIPFPNKPKITHECMDLIARMLTINIADRITLHEILQHPWILKPSESLISDNVKNTNSIKLSKTI